MLIVQCCQGLAYVDFSDDSHLAAALAKNKQDLLGKRLGIARSDPLQSKKKGTVGPSTTSKHGIANVIFTAMFFHYISTPINVCITAVIAFT